MQSDGNDDLNPTERFWNATIRSHRENLRDERAGWDVLGRTYRGSYWADGRASMEARPEDMMDEYGLEHEVNYLFGFADTLVANVCPPRPQVTLKPRLRREKDKTRHREVYVNDMMTRAKVGKHLRRAVRMACIYPRAFLKAYWSPDKNRPVLRAIKPHSIFFDTAADDWEDVRYVVEAKPITRAVFEERLRVKGKQGGVYRASAKDDVSYGSYPKWLVPQDRTDKSDEAQVVRNNYQWTTIYEVYDFVAKKYYHFLDGECRALYEGPLPWQYLNNPFKLLTFHDNLEDLGGISDGQLAFPSVQRINEMSSLRLHHAKMSVPTGMLNAKLLDDPEAFQTSLDRATSPGQYAVFETKQQVRPEDVFTQTPVPNLNLDFDKMMNQLIGDAEWVLAMPANQRGQASASDVATDIAAMDGAVKTRNKDRQDQVYELGEWSSLSFLALSAQLLPDDWEWDTDDGKGDTTITTLSMGFTDVDGNRIPFDMENLESNCHPFNAESLNSVAQFRKLQVLLPSLVGNPNVDQRKLTEMLLEMAFMQEILADEQAAAAPPPGGEVPMGPGAPSPDMMAPQSDAAVGPMEGGQVDTGDGGIDQGMVGAAGLGINI